MNENENKIKTQEYYINGIEQHLLAGRIQLLQSRRCRGREIGRFSPPRIFDDATGISVESVGDAALHLRHIILTESVSLVQVNREPRRREQIGHKFMEKITARSQT